MYRAFKNMIQNRYQRQNIIGDFLAVQWLGLCTFAAKGQKKTKKKTQQLNGGDLRTIVLINN